MVEQHQVAGPPRSPGFAQITAASADQPATPEEALDALYQLTRKIPGDADVHDALRAARDTVAEALTRVQPAKEDRAA